MRQCLAEDCRDHDNPPSTSRHWAALFIANQCLKTFFKLNSLKHGKALTLPAAPTLDQFPMSEKVTYRFFKGRLLLMDESLVEAEAALTFAFRNTPAAQVSRRRQILIYLIPVKMLLYQVRFVCALC